MRDALGVEDAMAAAIIHVQLQRLFDLHGIAAEELVFSPLFARNIGEGEIGRVVERAAEWIAHVARHARGRVWFEQLTMDPDSRTRPFVQTYPDGLPSAFHP